MNKEHSHPSAMWSRIGDVAARFGYVAYSVFWLGTVTAAVAGFMDEYTSISKAVFFSSLVALGALVFLEVVRRILMYIIAGKNLFARRFPLIAKVLLGLTVLAMLVAVPLFLFYDLPHERAEKAVETAEYQKALADLPSAQAEYDACIASTKENYVSAECRREKLGYNSCMEYGSRAFCLSTWDYESACKPSSFIPFNYGCAASTSGLKQTIQAYEEKYHITH